MAPQYEHVFKPIRIGPIDVSNRVFMPAHGLAFVAGGPHGSKIPSQECVSYYVERVRGGVGLLFHSTCINPRDALASAYYLDPDRPRKEANGALARGKRFSFEGDGRLPGPFRQSRLYRRAGGIASGL